MENNAVELLHQWLAQERGRQVALAAHVHVRPSVVAAWVSRRRPIPLEHATCIEVFTDGAVTRKAIRPNDWDRIWPELAASDEKGHQTTARQSAQAIKTESRQQAQGVAHA